ncbi:MAG: hypothetical protein LBS50_00450 [Prevotellaceae bacterium]|jgi:hypothetical protein|nr:hypothetical protein [Prevotellaceae bacterium]
MKNSSLFSKSTLGTIAMAQIYGGADTYCGSGTKCKDCKQTVCDTKISKCGSVLEDKFDFLTTSIMTLDNQVAHILM